MRETTRREFRVRRWLLAIWICFVARAAFYAAAFPVWEGFDEWAHFAVIQRIALRGEILVPRDSPISRQIETSLRFAPVPWELRHWPVPAVTHDAYWRLPAEERSRREAQFHALPAAWAREDAPGGSPAYEALQPPLYYWMTAPLLRILSAADLGTQVLWLRWFSIAIASMVIPLSFLVARSALRSDSLALGCAAVIAATPELAIDVARVGNECLAVALFTLLSWRLLEALRGEWSNRDALWLGIVLGLGLLAKAHFLTALPAVAGVLLYRFGRRAVQRAATVWQGLIVVSSSLSIAGWWYLRNFLTTGTWSGLNEAVMLRGTSAAKMLHSVVEIRWTAAVDGILLSHLWFGGWSSLTVRSWMYHLFYLLIVLAAIGLARELRQPPLAALLALYAGFWIGQLYNVVLLYLNVGIAVSMGWYLHAVIAAEVTLAVAGLRAVSPPMMKGRIALIGVVLFSLLDVYTIHAIALPYYSGVIGHRPNGSVAALHLADLSRVGLSTAVSRLAAFKTGVMNSPTLIVLWVLYLAATVGLVWIVAVCCVESRSRPAPVKPA